VWPLQLSWQPCISLGTVHQLVAKWRQTTLTLQKTHPNVLNIRIPEENGTRLRSWLRQHATSRKVAGSIADIIGFFSWPNPSSRTMVLGSTKPLTEMSTRNLPGGKGRPVRKADNLTAIFEPIVCKMWEPRRLVTLWASTAFYRDSFTFKLPRRHQTPSNMAVRVWCHSSLGQTAPLSLDAQQPHINPASRYNILICYADGISCKFKFLYLSNAIRTW
jgi:hypothetical protein